MAIICSNCGAKVLEGKLFCSACGNRLVQEAEQAALPYDAQQPQAQAMQQPIPPGPQPTGQQAQLPPPVKKKSKAPYIIAGAGVLVVALVVAGIFTNGFGLFGNSVETGEIVTSGDNFGTLANMPENASDEEMIAYMYIEYVISVFDMGHEFADDGLMIAAECPYGIAAASISSMRYAVDCLLELNGVAPPDDGRLYDWDEIAALGWVSPYPYIFEGVVLTAKDEKDAAVSCFEKAGLNPAISEDDHLLLFIINLDTGQLQTLRAALTEAESKIFAAYTPNPAAIPRSEYNFNVAYLLEQGAKALETTEAGETDDTEDTEDTEDAVGPDVALALQYYRAALSLEPFDGTIYASLAALCMDIGEAEAAIGWLNEGLYVDPENEVLNKLFEAMKEVLG